MGQLTDAEIAGRIGCNKLTVAKERNRRGIAGTFKGRTSNVATLSIRVTGGLPTAQNVFGQTTSGVSVDVPLSGNDPNGGPVTFKRVGGPVNGTGGLVTLNDGTTVMRYIPRADFVGFEEIRYVALTLTGRPSNVATIRIKVTPRDASALRAGSATSTNNAPSSGNS